MYYQCVIVFALFIMVVTKKPSNKEQQAVWHFECQLGVISDTECPVDGGWSPWSPWSACAGSCDDTGHRRRTRECNNPSPTADGLPCSGANHEMESCYINNCTIEDYRKLTEGDTIRTEALRLLEAVPLLSERCLLMECPFEAIEAALANDNTWQFNAESLWNALQCVKHNLGCPVVGEWGSWSKWSPCGARCGYGLRWRQRKCDMPPPSSSHLFCSGTPLQVDECEGNQCAVYKRDCGGNWSKWGVWSPCSENCGIGIKRRERVCLETSTPHLFGPWGTHCRGQHDQVEVCENKECKLDGGWSGWGAWGPCSQTCGAGRRSRSRSCSRPEPGGSGTFCSGPRVEVGSCHLKPCKIFSHTVAVFNGESFLQYDFKNKRSTFFHFYLKFLPLSPHGTLVRRGDVHNPIVRLSLQNWHICLDAGGISNACTVSRLCSRAVAEPAKWHSAMITITSSYTTMRLDNEPEPIKRRFSCNPDLPNDVVKIVVGEKLHGEIQELILNFIPLCISVDNNINNKSAFCPQIGSNIAYESAGAEESYVTLDNDQYLRVPCTVDRDSWEIKLTLKSQAENGVVLFMEDATSNTWLLLYLQNMRMKLKIAVKDFRSESVSSTDYPPNQWLDIVLSKNQGTNAIEASINGHERLHVLLEDMAGFSNINARQAYRDYYKTKDITHKSNVVQCTDELFIGGVSNEVKRNFASEDFTHFTGVIASMTVNNIILDLNDFSMERFKDNNIQVSSRTASVSGSYHETAWGRSNRLNLTCLHARSARSPNSAHWLFLDSTIIGGHADKSVRSIDDGKVLRLVATANNDVRGFYTCRAHRDKRHRNIVTYGVLGQVDHKLSGPDLTTTIAVITTLALVLGTLICLFTEGIHDIRDGYGFFRDAHFSPEEEAESICDYIDQNMHLMASKHAAEVAKARARRIGRQLASESSSNFENPESLMMVDNFGNTEDSITREPVLPALPEVKSSKEELAHEAFRCVQSYVSSPRHGSITSGRKLTSTSSVELSSPRLICSRLLLSKHGPRGSLFTKKNKKPYRKAKQELLTIKSSGNMSLPLAQKILQRFRELKGNDSSQTNEVRQPE